MVPLMVAVTACARNGAVLKKKPAIARVSATHKPHKDLRLPEYGMI
jgi:hypothetical protein